MFAHLLGGLKNKYVRVILAALGVGTAAVLLGLSFRVAISVVFIICWLGYVFLTVKRSKILSDSEKNIARILLIILVGLILSAIRGPKEIFNLILPMMIRSDVALLLWFSAGKGLWATALAFAAINTIGLITLYVTVDLVKSHGQRHAPKLLTIVLALLEKKIVFIRRHASIFLTEPTFKNVIDEFQEIILFVKECRGAIKRALAVLKSCLARWLASQALIWIFLVYIIPLPIPYLPSLIITAVRCKDVKYGLWPLVIANFLRGLIFTWLVWLGLARL